MKTRYAWVAALWFWLWILPAGLLAQKVSGYVTDAVTHQPIQGVAVVIKGTATGTATNSQGFFSLNLSEVPAVLVVSHISYLTSEYTLDGSLETLKIKLVPQTYKLFGPEIRPSPVTELLKERSFDILDYEFLGRNLLMLANRNGNMFRPCLLLSRLSGDTLCSLDVAKSERLYRDFEGNVYLITRNSAYLVNYHDNENKLELEFVMNKKGFFEVYPLVVDKKIPNWIVKIYRLQNQKLDYYLVNEENKNCEVFCSISNEDAIARARWGPYFHGTEADEHFARVIINRPVYAPLFRQGDSIIIMNYLNQSIDVYDNSGNKTGSVKAHFMKEKYCTEEIIQDKIQGKFYVVCRKNGIISLKEIDLTSGYALASVTVPDFVFIEKIRVHDNELFFLYREKTHAEMQRVYHLKI